MEPILRKVKNAATGIDNLSSWLFRLCSVELASVIAGIINLSFGSGGVPEQWLCAVVTLGMELVFRRPSTTHDILPTELADVQRVSSVKLLGVVKLGRI